MTIRLSDAARNAMAGDTVHKGLADALALSAIFLYSGTQPADANTGMSGTLLGIVTNASAGIHWEAPAVPVAGQIVKKVSETWTFTGLAAGTVGCYRIGLLSDNPPSATDATKVRVDGLVATAGGDANMSNTTVVVGAVSTVDSFSFTMPGQ